MEKPFWINFELAHYKSVSYFCLIAGVERLDCGYRVAGSLLLLLPVVSIYPSCFKKASFVNVDVSRI